MSLSSRRKELAKPPEHNPLDWRAAGNGTIRAFHRHITYRSGTRTNVGDDAPGSIELIMTYAGDSLDRLISSLVRYEQAQIIQMSA
jgi:hypothetical protein